MFSLRLSRPFQNLCTAHNARALHSLASQPAIARRSLFAFGNLPAKRTTSSPLQLQRRSASTTSFRSASFAYNVGAARSSLRAFGSNKLAFGTTSVLAGLGLGLAAFQLQRPALCEAPPTSPVNAPPRAEPTPTPMQPDDALPPPPRSSLNMLELGFGTVAGICAGVFVKKGAKMLAFVFGGVFVLLQYLVSMSLVRVNWSRAESRFEDAFFSHSKDATGQEVRRPPTVYLLFRWLVDFLTADFPPRATFLAGMALGLRLG